jgi:hypothetical protein
VGVGELGNGNMWNGNIGVGVGEMRNRNVSVSVGKMRNMSVNVGIGGMGEGEGGLDGCRLW